MKLVDSHAHLDDARFQGDLDAVLARARQAGVEHIVTVGTGLGSCRAAIALAESHPRFVHAAIGLHPHEADHANASIRGQLEALTAETHVVAIGETGLDYFYRLASHEAQKDLFAWHLELALARDLPIVLHIRDAFADALEILKHYSGRGLRGVAHCFSGTAEDAEEVLSTGLHVSFAGTLTFPNAGKLRDVAQIVPLDRLLIETDCPWLAPQTMRGTRNEPGNVVHVADELARLRGLEAAQVAEVGAANAERLFGFVSDSAK